MGLTYKAGRCYRRGETNFVDPSPEKGTLSLEQEDGRALTPFSCHRASSPLARADTHGPALMRQCSMSSGRLARRAPTSST
jgi:hypothetical protein